MADGHLNKCKTCTKYDVLKHRLANIEKIREHDRSRGKLQHRIEKNERYAKSVHGRVVCSKIKKDWIDRNPLKRKAHNIVGNAIKTGKLERKPCEQCGSEKRIHAHHDDYSKPLDVAWLCSEHHKKRHADNKK